MYVFQLPSGVEAELREMTGVEEDLLTNERLMRHGDPINQVLKNCLIRLGENDKPGMQEVLDLLAGDRLFLLVRLRQTSLGTEVALSLKCPNRLCLETNPITVDLEVLEVTAYQSEREYETTLPRSGKRVRFGLLDGHHEKRLAALKDPDATALMLIRILEIDGQPPSKKLVRELGLQDRHALRDAMRAVDGGIDTQIRHECQACGTSIQTRLEVEPHFLFPGAP